MDQLIKALPNGQWFFEELEKSVYNVGVSQANMPGRQSKVGNFPHYDYDTSVPHEDNVKQAKAHFDKHKVKLNDTQFNSHIAQAKAKAETAEKSDMEKVNAEDVSSKHTDPSINAALGGKYGKIHGGNPKKPTGALKDTPIENVNGKPMQRISGASAKRTRNEAGSSTEE